MYAWRWCALALAASLAGCQINPYPEDDWDEPDWSDDFPDDDPDDGPNTSGALDFRVEALTGPDLMGGETTGAVSATLCNRGTVPGMTEAVFVLSKDRTVDREDALLAWSPRVTLQAGLCRDVTVWVTAPDLRDGSYFLGAMVDPDEVDRESDERNNTLTTRTVSVDRTAPATPAVSWTAANGSQFRSLAIRTEAGATVKVFTGNNCTGGVVDSTTTDPGSYCEVTIRSTSGGTFSARAYDSAGNSSPCSPSVTYPGTDDPYETELAAPVLLGTSPGSPGASQEPVFNGKADPGVKVDVYEQPDCGGSVVSTVTTDGEGKFSYKASVAKDGKVFVSAKARKDSGGYYSTTSTCSNTMDYQNDCKPPEPPEITNTEWQYKESGRELLVTGTAEPGTSVSIYVDAECTGTPAKTVQVAADGTFSATVPFGAGFSHRVFVQATDASGNASTCAEGPAYELRCPAGFEDCDGDESNGCEVDLTKDADNCGACGHTCDDPTNATGVCAAASCGYTCKPGKYDCDGNASNGCESTYACSTQTCTVDRASELMITALSVVEDPVRTAPGGAWHFGTLMRALAGDQDPSSMVRTWLKTWNTQQSVNGLNLAARQQMQTKVLGPWETRSGGASKPLDFSKAPFRLLAISNRMDLRQTGLQAGEGRFIFGVLDPDGKPLEFTLILEYALPGTTAAAIQQWAKDWHALGAQGGVGGAGYNAKLQALTDRFAKTGVMTGRPFGSALNQLRTNELTLADPWEMREFNLTTTGLKPATVKLTPANTFENTSALGDFLKANQADVLAERHVIPDVLNGKSFLAAGSRAPLDFFWRAPGVNSDVRHKFSINTCNGCHTGETQTEFTHVSPRAAGKAAALSPFLRGTTVQDPVTKAVRTFDDLGRRVDDLKSLVCTGSGFTALTLPETNLPRARVH